MSRTLTTLGPSISPPRWAGDFLSRDHLIPGGAKVDAAQFTAQGSVVVTLTAGAAVNATSLAVTALSGPLNAGVVLYFGGQKFARLNKDAAAAAIALQVDPIPTALVTGDTYTVDGKGKKTIYSGTVLGRTYAERDAGTAFGPVADTDEEVRIVAFDVDDASIINDVELYRPGSVVKENYLPGIGNLTATQKGLIRSAYVCTVGVN